MGARPHSIFDVDYVPVCFTVVKAGKGRCVRVRGTRTAFPAEYATRLTLIWCNHSSASSAPDGVSVSRPPRRAAQTRDVPHIPAHRVQPHVGPARKVDLQTAAR